MTRTDGSTWLCRAITPRGFEAPITDIISPMPDGCTFCTGYYVVNRDDPKRSDWIMEPLGIEWSEARYLVFFHEHVHIVAFGHNGLLGERDLPHADPEAFLLFDFISDKGAFRCGATEQDSGIRMQLETVSSPITP